MDFVVERPPRWMREDRHVHFVRQGWVLALIVLMAPLFVKASPGVEGNSGKGSSTRVVGKSPRQLTRKTPWKPPLRVLSYDQFVRLSRSNRIFYIQGLRYALFDAARKTEAQRRAKSHASLALPETDSDIASAGGWLEEIIAPALGRWSTLSQGFDWLPEASAAATSTPCVRAYWIGYKDSNGTCVIPAEANPKSMPGYTICNPTVAGKIPAAPSSGDVDGFCKTNQLPADELATSIVSGHREADWQKLNLKLAQACTDLNDPSCGFIKKRLAEIHSYIDHPAPASNIVPLRIAAPAPPSGPLHFVNFVPKPAPGTAPAPTIATTTNPGSGKATLFIPDSYAGPAPGPVPAGTHLNDDTGVPVATVPPPTGSSKPARRNRNVRVPRSDPPEGGAGEEGAPPTPHTTSHRRRQLPAPLPTTEANGGDPNLAPNNNDGAPLAPPIPLLPPPPLAGQGSTQPQGGGAIAPDSLYNYAATIPPVAQMLRQNADGTANGALDALIETGPPDRCQPSHLIMELTLPCDTDKNGNPIHPDVCDATTGANTVMSLRDAQAMMCNNPPQYSFDQLRASQKALKDALSHMKELGANDRSYYQPLLEGMQNNLASCAAAAAQASQAGHSVASGSPSVLVQLSGDDATLSGSGQSSRVTNVNYLYESLPDFPGYQGNICNVRVTGTSSDNGSGGDLDGSSDPSPPPDAAPTGSHHHRHRRGSPPGSQ